MIRSTFTSCLLRWLSLGAAALVLGGCQTQRVTELPPDAQAIYPQVADLTLPITCLLPGQIRKLGTEITYLTPRRPVITSAGQCQIRGGDYAQFDRAKYKTALQVWLQEARTGNARAQTFVGEIYENGLGTEPNYDLARQWYRKAAEQGHRRAQVHLGLLYERGLGVKPDRLAALNWYRKAAGIKGRELGYASKGGTRPERADQASFETSSLEQSSTLGPTLEVYGAYNPEASSAPGEAESPSKLSPYSIVGRVTAPAGVASVMVNDREFEVDAYGAFRAGIPRDELSAPIEVVAIDKRGQRADLNFLLNRKAFDNAGLQNAQARLR